MDFRQHAMDAHWNAKDKGFHDAVDGNDFKWATLLMLLGSEVSEAFAEWRNSKPEFVGGEERLSDAFVEELADIYIRLGDMVVWSEVGLERFEAVVSAKLEKNRARPYLHGGRRC